MGYPRRLLGDDEHIVATMRPHWKRIFWRVVLFIVLTPVASFGAAVIPSGAAQKWLRLAVAVVWLLIVLRAVLWPVLNWVTTLYVLTDHRLITRVGVLARSGRDMPLSRVNDVSFSHSLIERMLRCGTLVIESAGERGQLVLDDVPRVEQVQREVYRLHELDEQRRWREAGGAEDEPADWPDADPHSVPGAPGGR